MKCIKLFIKWMFLCAFMKGEREGGKEEQREEERKRKRGRKTCLFDCFPVGVFVLLWCVRHTHVHMSACMYEQTCMCMYACGWECVCMHVEARGRYLCLPWPLPLYWGRVPQVNPEITNLASHLWGYLSLLQSQQGNGACSKGITGSWCSCLAL